MVKKRYEGALEIDESYHTTESDMMDPQIIVAVYSTLKEDVQKGEN